jgi:DNA topoisomerase-3
VGKQIVEPGWRRALPEALAPAKGREAPPARCCRPCAKGRTARGKACNLKDLWTQPPKPFTEGDLIKAMKNVAKLVEDPLLKQKLKDTTGIGTEATRARSSRACSTVVTWSRTARRWRPHLRPSA